VEAHLRTVHSVIDEALLAKQMKDLDLQQSAHMVSMKEKFPDRQAEPRRVGLLDGPEYLSIRGGARHDNDKADFRLSDVTSIMRMQTSIYVAVNPIIKYAGSGGRRRPDLSRHACIYVYTLPWQ
jgi:hypothetical protein